MFGVDPTRSDLHTHRRTDHRLARGFADGHSVASGNRLSYADSNPRR